jgi:hypothetical protein
MELNQRMSNAIRIAPFTGEWANAVRDFNHRIAASRQQLPDNQQPTLLPGSEVFLAIEGDCVRGGYILRRQKFFASGRTIDVAHYRLPLSEGVVDRRYATLGLRLVRDALTREPRLYALGMGGWKRPLPQMLQRLGWRICEVPFHFKVLRPSRFLRNIRIVRTTALRRLVLDAAALTGAGWVGMKVMGHGKRVAPEKHEIESAFDGWADAIWARSHNSYAMIAQRDAATLAALYPESESRFFRVHANGGWAVLLDTQMLDHLQFGDMRVGSIVDCMGPPDAAGPVMRAAAGVLEQRGVDLIVSNQLHHAWSDALLHAGVRKGPSNFLLALSPALAESVKGSGDGSLHFNRGDGDGPIHL